MNDEEVEIMIYKDDDGFWRMSSSVGMGVNKYDTYEKLVESLPKQIREKLE